MNKLSKYKKTYISSDFYFCCVLLTYILLVFRAPRRIGRCVRGVASESTHIWRSKLLANLLIYGAVIAFVPMIVICSVRISEGIFGSYDYKLKAYSNGDYFKLNEEYIEVKIVDKKDEVKTMKYFLDEVQVIESADKQSKLSKNSNKKKEDSSEILTTIKLEAKEHERFIEEIKKLSQEQTSCN